MDIRPIKTKDDYKNALLRIDELMDAKPDTEAGTELDVLVTLVDAYESKRFKIGAPDPVEAILFRMDQMGIDRKALEEYLGSKSRVSEVLNRKRGLSITQIKKLHFGLKMLLFVSPMPVADTTLRIGQQSGAILLTLFQTSSDDLVIYEGVNFN